jgi:drug/metabolite transporter (DMT)-like permease
VSNELLLLVLFSAMIHAGWNALIKSAKIDSLAAMGFMCMAGAVISLPLLLITNLPHIDSYFYLILSGFVHIAYYLLVGYSYRHGDFSAVYPIFRGGAPLLTVIAGSFYLNEWLGLYVYFGVVLLVSGLIISGLRAFKNKGLSLNSLSSALVLAGVVAGYTVIDGMGVRVSQSPFSYVLLTHIFNAVFMLPVIVFYIKPDVRAVSPVIWGKIAIAGGLSVLAYAIVLYAMTLAPIGIVSALRETSVLFAAIIGAVFLKEKLGAVHFIAACLIVIGLILIKGLA